jgi:hypothetical protein
VCTILFLGLWHDTHYLWILGLSDRDLHARYAGTFPGHIAQARVQGLTGPIALWGPFAPDVTSDTQAAEDDDDGSDEDMQDEADLGRLGEKPLPPDDDQDFGNDEDASGRQEGEGDEDGDQDGEDDDSDDAADAEGAQLDGDGETYDDEDAGYADLWMDVRFIIHICMYSLCLALHVAVSDALDETVSKVFKVSGLRGHRHRGEVAMLSTVDLRGRVDRIGDDRGHSCKA